MTTYASLHRVLIHDSQRTTVGFFVHCIVLFKDCTGNEQIYNKDVRVGFSMSKKVWSKWRTEARIMHLNTSLPR